MFSGLSILRLKLHLRIVMESAQNQNEKLIMGSSIAHVLRATAPFLITYPLH